MPKEQMTSSDKDANSFRIKDIIIIIIIIIITSHISLKELYYRSLMTPK